MTSKFKFSQARKRARKTGSGTEHECWGVYHRYPQSAVRPPQTPARDAGADHVVGYYVPGSIMYVTNDGGEKKM